jgi:hypothetical protein
MTVLHINALLENNRDSGMNYTQQKIITGHSKFMFLKKSKVKLK